MNRLMNCLKKNFPGPGLARFGSRLFCVALLAALPLLAGCAHLFSWMGGGPAKAEVKRDVFMTNAVGEVSSMDVLQLKVMRLADEYVATVAQASDDFAARAGTPEARLMGLKWKLSQATAAYTDATGVNPVINALDMLVLVTMARMVVEDYGVETFGTNALPLLETQRKFESNAWELASATLKPGQKGELQNMILEWRNKHPRQRYVGPLRFVEFAAALADKPTAANSAPNSIFSLLFINPLAGLDPTTAAIEQAQQFAERVMYYTQRMPMLLAWQSELVVYEIGNQPETRQLLDNSRQLADAAETFARTAGELPKVINDQRQAAIDQVFDRLLSEEGRARALLAETRQTFAAGSDAAQSLNAAIKSLDGFVRTVSAPATNGGHSTNGRPFDVLDYGAAAAQIGAAAKDLNSTLLTLNQSTAQLSEAGKAAASHADRMVLKWFWMGVALILVLLAGAVAATLACRALSNRLKLGRDKVGPAD